LGKVVQNTVCVHVTYDLFIFLIYHVNSFLHRQKDKKVQRLKNNKPGFKIGKRKGIKELISDFKNKKIKAGNGYDKNRAESERVTFILTPDGFRDLTRMITRLPPPGTPYKTTDREKNEKKHESRERRRKRGKKEKKRKKKHKKNIEIF
jgi:hypothetical protein